MMAAPDDAAGGTSDPPRVLIVSHSFAPQINPRALRWTEVARRLAARDYAVDVVSGWLPPLERTGAIDGVRVRRVGGGVSERLRGGMGRTQAVPSESAGGAAIAAPGSVRLLRRGATWAIRYVHDHTWKAVYWPDHACLWIGPGVRVATGLVRQHDYEAMISVSDPFSSHLVGLRIKRQFPSLRWIVDIGDPFAFRQGTPPNNRKLYRRRNYRAESDVLTAADAVSVTCAPALRKYENDFPHVAGKMVMIPPMVVSSPADPDGSAVFPRDGKIRLVYVGTLYPTIRNPAPLLRLFGRLANLELRNQVELHFFGAVGECRAQFESLVPAVREAIFLHGLVEHETVMRAMREADVLVNIGNRNPYQLPSKVAEYASIGKPIINLVAGANDTSAEFLRGYPALLNLDVSDAEKLDARISELAAFVHEAGKHDRPDPGRWRDPFSVEAIVAKYQDLITTAGKPVEQSG